MEQKKKMPQVRFKGYDDTWEQRKLENISDVKDGTHDSPKYVQNGHPFITSKNVGDGFINYDDIQYVSDKDYDEINRRSKVDIHDILMGMIGTIGNLALIREKPDFAIKNVALIKYTGDIDYKFLYQILQSHCVTSQLLNSIDGGTQKFIALNKIRGLDIPYPGEEEQRKIGLFFEQLDNLITLHQRKYDKLIKMKRAMLEKMFPKNGSLYPEIRFEGFTDAWEQRKVSDIATITAGGTPSTVEIEYWQPKEIPWLSSGEIHKKYVMETDNMISKKGLENSSAKWVEKGSVLIALAGQGKTRGTAAITRIRLTTNQSISALKFGDNVYPDYAFQNLDSRYDELRNVSSGDGTRGGLNKQLLSDLEMMIPEYEEQKKLGDYFSNLDTLITLHQRKLEKLKNIKKACLEKMFV